MGDRGFIVKQHSGHQPIEERRKARRFDASAIPNLKIINQAGRDENKMLNISRRGALIEGRELMSPESSISLHLFIAKSAYPLKGRITRCGLSSTNSNVP